MPITIQTQQEIKNDLIDDLVTRTNDSNVRLLAHPYNILATIVSGSIADLYDELLSATENSFVTTANNIDLNRLGAVFNVARGAATKSTGTAIFSGAVGNNIGANIVLTSLDGQEFETTDSGVIGSGGTVTIAISAVIGGNDGNLAGGAEINFSTEISGITPIAVIASGGLTGGTAEENDSSYRSRILLAVRNPAKGGTISDYERWVLARDNHNIATTKAFITPPSNVAGGGTVTITFTIEGTGGDKLETPNNTQITEVSNYIKTLFPAGAYLVIAALTTQDLDITISNLTVENGQVEVDVQANIKQILNEFLLRNAGLGTGVNLSQLYETISDAGGVASYTLTAPTGNVSASGNNIIKLGTLTFNN